jgi:hypothetical protein
VSVMRVPFTSAATAFVAVLACFSRYSTAHAECLSSASAVWAAHPGSHATWRLRLPGHEGVKCWFASGNGKAVDAYAARDTIFENSTVNAAPLPIPRPGFREALASDDRASTTVPTSEVRSSLIWAAPMKIDPMWDEIFIARGLRAKGLQYLSTPHQLIPSP